MTMTQRQAFQPFRVIITIGLIEILIGGITLLGTIISLAASINTKPQNVLIFVLSAACLSFALGVGILTLQRWAWRLLLYFSSVILLSKILLLMGIIHLNGALVPAVPPWLNHLISLGYHGAVILYLRKPAVKELFQI